MRHSHRTCAGKISPAFTCVASRAASAASAWCLKVTYISSQQLQLLVGGQAAAAHLAWPTRQQTGQQQRKGDGGQALTKKHPPAQHSTAQRVS